MVHKVGIYSGTFDPVHNGHIAFAKEAVERCGLDKVFLLVEPQPRRKQGVKAQHHRQRMVELAIAKEPHLGSIVLDQSRFTVTETLPPLLARFKGMQIHFLMGDDTLTHFTDADWPHLNEFVKAVTLIVGARQQSIAEVERQLELIRKTRGARIRATVFQSNLPKASSQSIRTALRKGARPPEVSPEVFRYIQTEGLYF